MCIYCACVVYMYEYAVYVCLSFMCHKFIIYTYTYLSIL